MWLWIFTSRFNILTLTRFCSDQQIRRRLTPFKTCLRSTLTQIVSRKTSRREPQDEAQTSDLCLYLLQKMMHTGNVPIRVMCAACWSSTPVLPVGPFTCSWSTLPTLSVVCVWGVFSKAERSAVYSHMACFHVFAWQHVIILAYTSVFWNPSTCGLSVHLVLAIDGIS